MSREAVRQWRAKPGFPEPLGRVGQSVIWDWPAGSEMAWTQPPLPFGRVTPPGSDRGPERERGWVPLLSLLLPRIRSTPRRTVMPRYRFQWANLPDPVIRALTKDYDLSGPRTTRGAPVLVRSATQRRVRPGELGRAPGVLAGTGHRPPASRWSSNSGISVSAKVRTIQPTKRASWSTCALAETPAGLRQVVLDAFIDVGERGVGGHHGDKASYGATCQADCGRFET